MGNAESVVMENENTENESVTHARIRRRRRHFQTAHHELSASNSIDENSWWSTVENENLILDQVPTELTSLTDAAESENRNDFRVLQKLNDENVNLTLKKITNNNNNNNDNNINEFVQKLEIVESENGNENQNQNEKIHKAENYENVLSADYSDSGRSECALASTIREQSLEEFREELRQKRLARQTAVQDLRVEIATLRKQLNTEQALTQCLRQKHQVNKSVEDTSSSSSSTTKTSIEHVNKDCTDNGACALDTDDTDPMSRGRHANIELANAQLALQLANSENISLRAELGVVQKQVGTLKEVISCCKQMLTVKEEQCNGLKAKLTEIETSFGEREMKIMSENLRHEYERQLGNIRQLRELYEERQRISAAEHENLQRLISIKKDELLAEQEKTKNFEERNQTLIKEVESANKELATLREECNEHKFEKKALKEEMGAVNTLFSQMVMGFNGKNNLDIDRLTTMLEENRSLLNDMATKEVSCTDGATLPKLLFELVEQATLSSGRSSRSATPALEEQHTPKESKDETETEEKLKEQKDEKEVHTHHNENVATNMNNDVVKHVENVDAAECATSICYGAAATDQVNIATNGNYNGIPKKQQQRRNVSSIKTKLYATTTSSPTSSSSLLSSSASSSSSSGAMTMKFHEPEVIGKVASTQEIIGNLPKVWKVLMELLSHHRIEQVQFEETGNSEDCYKSVETPNGPKAELSVSKTYIKLKDLILEKKSLVKETNRLKTLNSHLECRLNTQEKRLSAVSLELTKTWHLVGKMQRQHRQLHTQEQILRYQLQQKRRLLSELKDELEYCRRKWAAARAKNDESQEQCNDLRREFARRKLEDANNSAESGYSDSGPPSDEEERGAVGGCANSRRKYLREMFEHTRKIKRMQSTSPGRAAAYGACGSVAAGNATASTIGNSLDNSATQETEIVLRWNSAPPTCGWRRRDNGDDDDGDEGGNEEVELPPRLLVVSRGNSGAIPKQHAGSRIASPDAGRETDASSSNTERATRIQRLEEQCKSLIQQVLETSDNRERLEVQLCRFQDDIAPVQYAVPLEEFINRRRYERMSRASSAPATGSLTPREEEYTRKRSERLERLEEESRQLMSRIKRTSDRGHYLRCSLDRIRRAPSREESFDSAAEDDSKKVDVKDSIEEAHEENPKAENPLTTEEEAYTVRRAARLKRLEEEGQQLLGTLSRNAQRGHTLESKLDNLHERYGKSEEREEEKSDSTKSKTLEHSSSDCNIAQRLEDINQISVNRDERLRLLEEEGNQLIARLSNTSERGTRMINRIAEHAQRREARMNATANVDAAEVESESHPPSVENATNEETPAATALLPTLKNVASSSIVSDELTECVTVTTTPSQVATRELGAVPKSKPMAQLCAARHKSERFSSEKKVSDDDATCSTGESLEEMVKRLRDTPYPKGKKASEIENITAEQQELQKEMESAEKEQKESSPEK